MPDIKFGLRRASHHVSQPTCLSLLILCVFANRVPLPTPERSRSHELFVHRLDSNNRTKYPLLYLSKPTVILQDQDKVEFNLHQIQHKAQDL